MTGAAAGTAWRLIVPGLQSSRAAAASGPSAVDLRPASAAEDSRIRIYWSAERVISESAQCGICLVRRAAGSA
jgi:hypothetical protein